MRKPEHRLKYLTDYEKTSLFNSLLHDNSRHAIRNQAIFLTAKYCALRASEIGLLQLSDYDPYRNVIHCERLKGSNCNTLQIIDPEVSNSLNQYIYFRKTIPVSTNILFLSQNLTPISRQQLDRLIKYYGKLAAIPEDKRHFHVLKHTRGVELAEAGLDMREIQFWLGHKNISNSQIYISYTARQYEAIYHKLILELKKA